MNRIRFHQGTIILIGYGNSNCKTVWESSWILIHKNQNRSYLIIRISSFYFLFLHLAHSKSIFRLLLGILFRILSHSAAVYCLALLYTDRHMSLDKPAYTLTHCSYPFSFSIPIRWIRVIQLYSIHIEMISRTKQTRKKMENIVWLGEKKRNRTNC